MNKYARGIIAGLVATAVLSMMMFAKGKMGVMPELDIIAMLAGKMGGAAMMGWAAHFMIGAILYGVGFVVLYNLLPGKGAVAKGALFGVLGWLMMMLLVMPMMGMGMFAMSMGMMA
ncbi:MAG: DUF6789 family protein, partial [Lysobacterales bacterium]